MDQAQLIAVIDSVLPHADRRRDDFLDLFPWIGFPHRPGDAAWPDEGKREVVRALEREPELRIFHDHTQYFCGSSAIVTHEQLAEWLLMRASKVGAAQAVADTEQYLKAEEIPYAFISAIAGVEVSAGHE